MCAGGFERRCSYLVSMLRSESSCNGDGTACVTSPSRQETVETFRGSAPIATTHINVGVNERGSCAPTATARIRVGVNERQMMRHNWLELFRRVAFGMAFS